MTKMTVEYLPSLLVEYGNRIQTNLSMLINMTKNTEASLDAIDIEPATLQVMPDRQLSDSMGKLSTKYKSVDAMINIYTPINKSDKARLLRSKSCTLFFTTFFCRKTKTKVLPKTAPNPITHIMTISTRSDNNLSHVRYGDLSSAAEQITSSATG